LSTLPTFHQAIGKVQPQTDVRYQFAHVAKSHESQLNHSRRGVCGGMPGAVLAETTTHAGQRGIKISHPQKKLRRAFPKH
jgi:hypothetical protein